jgi:hypothetical protein
MSTSLSRPAHVVEVWLGSIWGADWGRSIKTHPGNAAVCYIVGACVCMSSCLCMSWCVVGWPTLRRFVDRTVAGQPLQVHC